MITKTILDARLSDIEQKLEKKIDFKVGQAVQKRESEITKLKSDLKTLEEKKVDGSLIDEIESLRTRVERLERSIPGAMIEPAPKDNPNEHKDEPDTITPDEI